MMKRDHTPTVPLRVGGEKIATHTAKSPLVSPSRKTDTTTNGNVALTGLNGNETRRNTSMPGVFNIPQRQQNPFPFFTFEKLFKGTEAALVFRTGEKRRIVFIDILFYHTAG